MRRLLIIPGLLFGLLFAGGGFFLLSETALPMWQSWQDMQNWQSSVLYEDVHVSLVIESHNVMGLHRAALFHAGHTNRHAGNRNSRDVRAKQ